MSSAADLNFDRVKDCPLAIIAVDEIVECGIDGSHCQVDGCEEWLEHLAQLKQTEPGGWANWDVIGWGLGVAIVGLLSLWIAERVF